MKKLDTLLAIAVLILLASCVTSSQARKVTPSGFLGDSASLLKKGGKNDALLVYRSKNANWASYDKIIFEPVTIWAVEHYTLPPAALADLQRLVDHFDRSLRDKLSRDYQLIDTPSAGAMRIQVAIVGGGQANATLKIAKTVAPYAGYADTLWTFVTGKPAFTGEGSMEYMVRDSVSGELLAAGADRRVGGTQLGAATLSSWGDVQNILEYWSDEAVYRLCIDRGGKNCPEPKAGLVKNPIM